MLSLEDRVMLIDFQAKTSGKTNAEIEESLSQSLGLKFELKEISAELTDILTTADRGETMVSGDTLALIVTLAIATGVIFLALNSIYTTLRTIAGQLRVIIDLARQRD